MASRKRVAKSVKKSLKRLPKLVAKQMPNAAMLATGGVGSLAIKSATVAAKRKLAKKAANKAVRKVKLPGQKRKMKIIRRDR